MYDTYLCLTFEHRVSEIKIGEHFESYFENFESSLPIDITERNFISPFRSWLFYLRFDEAKRREEIFYTRTLLIARYAILFGRRQFPERRARNLDRGYK